jgi:hypothetical protein
MNTPISSLPTPPLPRTRRRLAVRGVKTFSNGSLKIKIRVSTRKSLAPGLVPVIWKPAFAKEDVKNQETRSGVGSTYQTSFFCWIISTRLKKLMFEYELARG